MKNFKKIAFGLLVGALALGFSAFTTKNSNVSRKQMNARLATQTWFFNGSTLSQDKSEANYATSPAQECDGIADLPCEIQFDASSYTMPATNTPLQNYLNSKSSTQIRSDAVSVRSE